MIKEVFSFLKKYWLPVGAFAISLIMFLPSISGFFTHDDFYFLKIANVSSYGEFLNFFNPVRDVEGIGVYRPLTLRVFYFLGVTLFNLNPLGLRIIAFLTFYADVLLVGFLVKQLSGSVKVAALSIFLYATSVTHFGQLYYIGAYQELFLTLTFLTSVIFFVKYETGNKEVGAIKNLLISLFLFLLSLMSKETGVMIPAVLVLTHLYFKITHKDKVSTKKLIFSLIPYLVILTTYLILHFLSFGLIQGDSYVWDFSITKSINTTVWYFLWSINLPETLIDFVGPGIHLNPNLMKYWSKEIVPIFGLFAVQVVLILYAMLKSKFLNLKSHILIILFSVSWFTLTLLPVIFLPLHKFTYYLTLPLVGVVLLLSYLFVNLKSKIYILFCLVWVALSFFSLRLTTKTNWITQGVKTSERVNNYFKENREALGSTDISFIDTSGDEDLPWSPTLTLKTVMSEYNFFDVFYPELREQISYGDKNAEVQIKSGELLGY